MADLESKEGLLALVQQLQGQVNELEAWLGLLIVAGGVATTTGFQLTLTSDRADFLRSKMPRAEVRIAVEYDPAHDRFTLDAI